ncbi:MAG: phosphatidate cytidylyltransferase [Planctomycetota bacterium]|nr:phosphatidate cytidylyltransferase [Planctomycetota bacterium]
MFLEKLCPLLFGFVQESSDLSLPFDKRTAWLIAGVMILLIIGSLVGKLLERSSEERLNSAVVRSFNQRIRSWWLMCAILIAGLVIGQAGTVVLFGMIAFWALREFITMTPTRRGDHRALFWVLIIFTPLQFVLVGLNDERQMFKVLLPIIAALFVPMRIALANDEKRYLERSAKILIGILICVYALSFAPALLFLEIVDSSGAPWSTDAALSANKGLLFFFVLITQLNDVMQFGWGKLIGRNLIADRINTSRTVEGVIAAAASSALLGALFSWVTPFTFWQAAIIAVVISVTGFAGGLTMSAIKRDRGVKDFGTLLQGHAGILDRIDSLCFAAPVFYLITEFFFTK